MTDLEQAIRRIHEAPDVPGLSDALLHVLTVIGDHERRIDQLETDRAERRRMLARYLLTRDGGDHV